MNRMGPEQAHRLLEHSFAQYQADRSVVGLVRGIERGRRLLDEIAAELGGHDAPILDYARLRERISQRERRRRGRRARSAARRPTTRWPRCAAATSSGSPTAAAAGWRWCWNPTATVPIRGRWCSPNTAGRAGFRRPTTRARLRRSGR
ncbi:putative helicase helY domain protein [Mycobacterium xenopi 4042]|uniref:Putative helicase helY domain protein n=1 Tax=Mycobacterium xenopi 4042 TaxID=1299334 RepID=X8BFB4_MYCXE|nr:putative helicase helY domain protein [Mycobacterium xenopi 4042]